MKQKIKEWVLAKLKLKNGVNTIDVLMFLYGKVNPTMIDSRIYDEVIDELLADKEISILKFTDPESATGTKEILFVKGTNFLNLSELTQDAKTRDSGKDGLA